MKGRPPKKKPQTYHQGSRVQTALVVRALKVSSPQGGNGLVVAPQEENNNDVKTPGTDDLAPRSLGLDVERGHGGKGGQGIPGGHVALGEVQRDHDAAADDAQTDEDVATHLGEAQEDRGVEADALDELGLFGAQDGLEPGEHALPHWGRRMFAIGMIDLGGVDDGMTGTKEGEEQGEDDGETGGGGQ